MLTNFQEILNFKSFLLLFLYGLWKYSLKPPKVVCLKHKTPKLFKISLLDLTSRFFKPSHIRFLRNHQRFPHTASIQFQQFIVYTKLFSPQAQKKASIEHKLREIWFKKLYQIVNLLDGCVCMNVLMLILLILESLYHFVFELIFYLSARFVQYLM